MKKIDLIGAALTFKTATTGGLEILEVNAIKFKLKSPTLVDSGKVPLITPVDVSNASPVGNGVAGSTEYVIASLIETPFIGASAETLSLYGTPIVASIKVESVKIIDSV